MPRSCRSTVKRLLIALALAGVGLTACGTVPTAWSTPPKATPQQIADGIVAHNKAFEAFEASPEGRAAKAAEKAAAERASPAGKLKAYLQVSRRLAAARRCENALLDLGYDMTCTDDETSGTLVVAGDAANRVSVRKFVRLFNPKDLRSLEFKTLRFWNGSMFSSFQEDYDLSQ